MAADRVISIVGVTGEGEHKLVALTSGGVLYERVNDPRHTNLGPGSPSRSYMWRRIKGPLEE
jgi:hypothetical protein